MGLDDRLKRIETKRASKAPFKIETQEQTQAWLTLILSDASQAQPLPEGIPTTQTGRWLAGAR